MPIGAIQKPQASDQTLFDTFSFEHQTFFLTLKIDIFFKSLFSITFLKPLFHHQYMDSFGLIGDGNSTDRHHCRCISSPVAEL